MKGGGSEKDEENDNGVEMEMTRRALKQRGKKEEMRTVIERGE